MPNTTDQFARQIAVGDTLLLRWPPYSLVEILARPEEHEGTVAVGCFRMRDVATGVRFLMSSDGIDAMYTQGRRMDGATNA